MMSSERRQERKEGKPAGIVSNLQFIPPGLLLGAPHCSGQQQPEPPACWPLPLVQQPLPLLLPQPQLQLLPQVQLLPQLQPLLLPLLQLPLLWCRRRRDRRGLWWLRQQPPPPELQQHPELELQQETGHGLLGGHLGGHLGGGWHCFWLCWQDISAGMEGAERQNEGKAQDQTF